MLSRFWIGSNHRKNSSQRAVPVPLEQGGDIDLDPLRRDVVTVSQNLANFPKIDLSNHNRSSTAIAEHETMKQDLRSKPELPNYPVATEDPEAWYRQGNLYRDARKLDVALA
ncbi:hypothetical protein, partial [Chamaesiphon polymorphus]